MRLIDPNIRAAFQVFAPDHHRNSVHNEHIHRLCGRLIPFMEPHLQRVRTQTSLHRLHRPFDCFKRCFRRIIELWRAAGLSRSQWLFWRGRPWFG